MSSAATYRLLAAIDEFTRAFPEDHGDIKERLGEIEKQVRGDVFAQVDDNTSPGQQAAKAAARGDAERMNARRSPQPRTDNQPKTFQDARRAAEDRIQDTAAPEPAAAAAGPSA